MSITVAFGRWGLPYLICIGRWEWTCLRTQDIESPGRRRWRVEHSPGSDQQLSEVVVHCGRIAHCFTRWPKAKPLPRERVGSSAARPDADNLDHAESAAGFRQR